MKTNPNATAAGGSTGVAALVVYLAELAGLNMPAPVAIVAAGALTVVVLAIGRDGLRGIARRVWAGKPAPPPRR